MKKLKEKLSEKDPFDEKYKVIRDPENPLTDKEKENLLKKTKYVGGALAGLGSFEVAVSEAARRKLSEEAKERMADKIKKSRVAGIGSMVIGAGMVSGVHAYQHYKDRKKQEEEKEFSAVDNIGLEAAKLNFRRYQDAQIQSRAKMRLAAAQQRMSQRKAELIQKQAIEAEKSRANKNIQGLSVFKRPSVVLKTVSMN